MRLPPLIAWYQHLLDTQLVLAVLLGIVLVAIGVLLFRAALQLFLLFLILLLIAIGASYLFQGEAATEEDLRQGAREIQEALEGGDPPPAEAGSGAAPPPPREPPPRTPR